MEIVTQVTELLQGLLEESMDVLARETGCVKRERKFSGSTLLSTLVLTVLRNPKPKPRDYQTTAAQLGVDVTENAIAQRFTPELVKFLEAALKRVLSHVLTTDAPPIELLERFTEVVIGDSTTITLPDEYAEQFPGCGGSSRQRESGVEDPSALGPASWPLAGAAGAGPGERCQESDHRTPLARGQPVDLRLGLFLPRSLRARGAGGGLLAVAAAARDDGLRCGRKTASRCGSFSPKTRNAGSSTCACNSAKNGCRADWWPCASRRKSPRGGGRKSAKKPAITAASPRRSIWSSRSGRSSSPTARRRC